MNLEEMVEDVYTRLDESESDPAFYLEEDVVGSINEGHEEVADLTEWYEVQTTLTLYSNKTYYDIARYLNSDVDFLRVKSIYNTTTSQWLAPLPRRVLDEHTYRFWETNQGQPEYWFMRGHWWLGLFPRVNGDSGDTLTVWSAAMPPELAEDEDEPGFWQDRHDALVEYALYDLLCQDRELEKSMEYYKRFLEKAQDIKTRVDNRSQADRLENMGGPC